MDFKDKLHLVIYRVRERGLEIFVRERDDEHYEFPATPSSLDIDKLTTDLESIDLDAPVQASSAESATRAVAIEGDYHDIPSLKKLLLEDAKRLRQQLREAPSLEEGSFVAVKGMAKRLLPEQYRMLQELRDILVDRNSTKYM